MYSVEVPKELEDASEEELRQWIESGDASDIEYVKEFIGEGIAYYATRRLAPKMRAFINIDIDWFNRMQLTPYPYPTDELSYGRHQDL